MKKNLLSIVYFDELIKKSIEKSKSLILIAVASSLLASSAAFVYGMIKTFTVILNFVISYGEDALGVIALLELMDIFLIATVLFIFAMGMYELFIDTIALPEWLIIRTLHDLKIKLSSVVILVMGIIFLEHLVEWKDPLGTLFFGISVAVVSVTLIAFSYFGQKE
ncbi:MAG: YqhA family protein [Candidatus Methanoperedens sp.]|nr:YqhA family protein [Candidatus Methanoperedens sp.]